MDNNVLFVDFEWCSGCKSCELACRNEHDFPRDQWGIRVLESRPWQLDDGTWSWDYIPLPSKLCDLCAEKVNRGEEPSCVMHCQAKCIEYGPLESFADRLTSRTMIIKP